MIETKITVSTHLQSWQAHDWFIFLAAPITMIVLKRHTVKDSCETTAQRISERIGLDFESIALSKSIKNMIIHGHVQLSIDEDNEELFRLFLEHDQPFIFDFIRSGGMKSIRFNFRQLTIGSRYIHEVFADQVIAKRCGKEVFDRYSDTSVSSIRRMVTLKEAWQICMNEQSATILVWFCEEIIHSILPNVSMKTIHEEMRNKHTLRFSPTIVERFEKQFGKIDHMSAYKRDLDPDHFHDFLISNCQTCMYDGHKIFHDNALLIISTSDDPVKALAEFVEKNTYDLIFSLQFVSYCFLDYLIDHFHETLMTIIHNARDQLDNSYDVFNRTYAPWSPP